MVSAFSDLIAVTDKTTPQIGAGVYYVLTTAVIMTYREIRLGSINSELVECRAKTRCTRTKNAEVPAPVLAEHLSVFLGLALRDLRLRHGTVPRHTSSFSEVERNFNHNPAQSLVRATTKCGKTSGFEPLTPATDGAGKKCDPPQSRPPPANKPTYAQDPELRSATRIWRVSSVIVNVPQQSSVHGIRKPKNHPPANISWTDICRFRSETCDHDPLSRTLLPGASDRR